MLIIKSLHLVFVISWFAGLFYLPRIFVNLAMVEPGSEAERARLLLMARKLLRFSTILAIPALGAAEIINPARGAIPGAETPDGFAEQLLGLLNRPTKMLIMADEAIAFAREWDAGTQGARLAALYRQLLRAPRAIDCSLAVSANP